MKLASRFFSCIPPAPRLHAAAKRIWHCGHYAASWIPLTPLGLLTVPILIWMVPTYGLGRRDLVLLALSLAGLVVVGCALLMVIVTAVFLKLYRIKPDDTALVLEAGVRCRTGFRLGRMAWNPLVRIDVSWEHPRGSHAELIPTWDGAVEELMATERGCGDAIIRRFTISDVLGLARLTVRKRALRSFEIKPACGKAPGLVLLPQLIDGDEIDHPEGKPLGDLMETRAYIPGDPLKLVLWKAYARTGQMLVRLPERSAARNEKTMAYFVAGDGDEPAAGIARTALEVGALGSDYLFGADGCDTPMQTAQEAVNRVVRTAAARERGGEGLGEFLAQGNRLGLKSCILFVPSRHGDWLERVVQQLAGQAGEFRVLVGVDDMEADRSDRWFERLVFSPSTRRGSRTGDLQHICARLSQVADEVRVLNRVSGETIDHGATKQAA